MTDSSIEECFELKFSEEDDFHGNCLQKLPPLFKFIPFDNFKYELERDEEEKTNEKEPEWLSLPTIFLKNDRFLGGGMWGSVFLCSISETEEPVIVKVANRKIYKYSGGYSVSDEVYALIDEINALQTIKHIPCHNNIIFPTFLNQGYILIKTSKEYVRLPAIILKCPIGKPLKYQPVIPIDKRKEIAKEITIKVIEALRPVHELGYLHGDISPSNLLIFDEKFILIDWGLANHYTSFDILDYNKKIDGDFVKLNKSTFLDYKGISELWRFIVFGEENEYKKDPDYIEIEKRLESWYFLNYHELLSLNITSII
jgi:serine/threonine protein kinase